VRTITNSANTAQTILLPASTNSIQFYRLRF
jgi:hypothetical protein